MPERRWGRGTRKITEFSTEKWVFTVTGNKLCKITKWNISTLNFFGLKTTVILEASIQVADSKRTSKVRSRYVSFSWSEKLKCTPPCQEEIFRLCILKSPNDITPKQQSFHGKSEYDYKSDQLAAPKCQNRFFAVAWGLSCWRLLVIE